MPWEDEGQSKWSELLHGTYGAHEADQGYTLSRAQGSGRALAKDLNVLDGRSQSVGGVGESQVRIGAVDLAASNIAASGMAPTPRRDETTDCL